MSDNVNKVFFLYSNNEKSNEASREIENSGQQKVSQREELVSDLHESQSLAAISSLVSRRTGQEERGKDRKEVGKSERTQEKINSLVTIRSMRAS